MDARSFLPAFLLLTGVSWYKKGVWIPNDFLWEFFLAKTMV